MRITERTNSQWVNDLQQNGSTRLQAICDLRDFLERGLYHYLSNTQDDLAYRPGEELRHIAQEFATESLFKVLDNLALFRSTSQFTTWAAKFAARAATTGLSCVRPTQLEPEPLNPVTDYVLLEMSKAVRAEHNELAKRIAD